jgi:hypothetical protein
VCDPGFYCPGHAADTRHFGSKPILVPIGTVSTTRREIVTRDVVLQDVSTVFELGAPIVSVDVRT